MSCVRKDGTRFSCVSGIGQEKSKFVGMENGKIVEREAIQTLAGELTPFSRSHPYLAHNIVCVPSVVAQKVSLNELVCRLNTFLRKYVSLSEVQYLIATHYILLSWVYEQFNALPYLRVRGEFGTGKTRFLRTHGGLCYNAMFESTIAPIFHLLHDDQGTLVLDEADFRDSSETSDIVKIL